MLGYKVNLTRFSHDPNKVISNFSSNVLTEDEKSLLCKELRFCIPPKKIEYADILTKFELLYRDTILFEMKSKTCDFLKSKLKDICSCTLKSCSFDKVEKDLSGGKSLLKVNTCWFMNIPLEETLKNCVNDLFSNNFYGGQLSRIVWYELLKLAATESSLIFDKLYKEIDRAAMDSPLDRAMANAFLCHYEKNWPNECPSQFKPVVYRCYLDDIFVMFKSKEHLKLLFN